MGTRSLIHVVDEENELLMTIYTQYDGYPRGVGAEIKRFVGDQIARNGISGPGTFNGAGDLAARLVTCLKEGKWDDAGNIYICTPGERNCGEEYTYIIRPNTENRFSDSGGDGSIFLAVLTFDQKVLFCGNIRDFDPDEAESVENPISWKDNEVCKKVIPALKPQEG